MWVQEEGESEGHAVMVWRGIATSSHAQASRLPSGLSARENVAGAVPHSHVCRRQVSIVQACQRRLMHRVPPGAFERLERHAWQHARAVLRGGGGGTPSPYPTCSSKTEETKGMPLPQLNCAGELPEGVHQATIDEVIAQFGSGTSQRQAVTARLRRIYHLAHATSKLERLILFGS